LPLRPIVKGTLKTGGSISCSLRPLGSPGPQHCGAGLTQDRSWLRTIYPSRSFDVPEVLMQSPVVASLGFWLQCAEEVCHVSPL
jgi:hypothetical protein